ncbi:MAG: AbrB/MazE/SpoVT family DNA-binding domain-containing protein [Candidatus Electronema sp. V4]|uniref:AbrB/MazE/SpoVT family DNA-binding domain-containing protein n=1 Tax=Candidatus Electronema sp. V4 TaxID=3454756 RepID=UPI0040555FBF
MRVTRTGQVTIPVTVRRKMGIASKTEVDFIEENGRFYIVKHEHVSKFKKLRGAATERLTTDEIMSLTRER